MPELANKSDGVLSDTSLLMEIQRRAFKFFWERADKRTGLVSDRASNVGADSYNVASIAATGYALTALPIGVKHHWVEHKIAAERAQTTLTFIEESMKHQNGWLYHFVDKSTGQRVWNCEISTIDTGLLVCGALTAAQFFGGRVAECANRLNNRLDWQWARTNGGTQNTKLLLSHGWKPESGFLPNDWDEYNEGILLYLLGMGAQRAPLSPECWRAWQRRRFKYGERTTLTGGPIFLHQMPYHYFDLRDMRDGLGFNYWAESVEAAKIHRQFCIDRSKGRKSYGVDLWGLNASDGPSGYMAYGIPTPEDGTLSSTGALASICQTPTKSIAALGHIYKTTHAKIWGRYGLSNAFNLDKDWYDEDVIGIDLGMALLAIENYRNESVWKWFNSHPSIARGIKIAGLRPLPKTRK
jgi:hypothetical protein